MQMIKIEFFWNHYLFVITGEISPYLVFEYFPNNINCLTQIHHTIWVECVKSIEFSQNDLVEGRFIRTYLGNEYYCGEYKGNRVAWAYNNPSGAHVFIQVNNDNYKVFVPNANNDSNTLWAIRLCREIFLYNLLKEGFVPLHASACNYRGKTILSIGNKGCGKTTTMCSIVKHGGLPLSNDLTLVGLEQTGKMLLANGWPWRVAIGNSIAQKMRLEANKNGDKVKLTPDGFCKVMNCEWSWTGEPAVILFPNVSANADLIIRKLKREDVETIILRKGIEYPVINNIFSCSQLSINFTKVISSLSNSCLSYSIQGDIWSEISSIIDSVGI